MQVGCNILHMCVAHENLGSWFSRLKVALHHFDFDVGSTFDMVEHLGLKVCGFYGQHPS